MNYKYITEDNLENKQTYMYSEYGGEDFLTAYVKSRENAIANVHLEGVHNTYTELKYIWKNIRDAEVIEAEIKDRIDLYVKTFEVRKRLYTGYDEMWKPCKNTYRDYVNYLLLGNILIVAFRKTGCAKYASCLMKLTDSLISVMKYLNEAEQCELADILGSELEIYGKLKKIGGTQ